MAYGSSPDDEAAHLRSRYLDLVRGAVTHTLYRPIDVPDNDDVPERQRARAAQTSSSSPDFVEVRSAGRDWPRFAQTMVGLRRLENLQHCVECVLSEGVPGDLIEAGVWRGGAVIFMRAILEAWGDDERLVFAADSFCGLPPPSEDEYPADTGSKLHEFASLAVPRDEVERNLALYGLLDDRTRFLEGWFRDTLPSVRDHAWSVVRLDGDLYESTMDGLVNLYPGLAPGGFLIVDDYAHKACRLAVTDYRDAHGIVDPIEQIDWTGVYWRRSAEE